MGRSRSGCGSGRPGEPRASGGLGPDLRKRHGASYTPGLQALKEAFPERAVQLTEDEIVRLVRAELCLRLPEVGVAQLADDVTWPTVERHLRLEQLGRP